MTALKKMLREQTLKAKKQDFLNQLRLVMIRARDEMQKGFVVAMEKHYRWREYGVTDEEITGLSVDLIGDKLALEFCSDAIKIVSKRLEDAKESR